MKMPPGPRGREVLGFFGGGSFGGTLQFLEQTARRYGPFSAFRIFGKRIYLADDAEIVREILVTRQHGFVRDTGAALLRELVGDGLITREEPSHKERRRLLQPAFHREQIAGYAAIMTREAQQMANEWREAQTVDIRAEMRRLTLGIVGAALFGADFREDAAKVAVVLESVARRSRWLGPAFAFIEPLAVLYRRWFPQGPSLFFRRERAQLDRIVGPIVEQRRTASGRDVLSLILNAQEDGQRLDTEDVRNEIVTFALAGHETTATALTWTWYLLARHPRVEEKLHAELDEVLGERPATFEDVPRLRYTGFVFQEALRLYPPALAFARRPKHEVELAGYTVPRGASIFLSPYITQRNERYFERPDAFEPERWENPNYPKFAYFPFGGGAKMCIGEPFARMEGLLALATLACEWRLSCADEGAVGIGGSAVLAPDRTIRMRTSRRSRREIMAAAGTH